VVGEDDPAVFHRPCDSEKRMMHLATMLFGREEGAYRAERISVLVHPTGADRPGDTPFAKSEANVGAADIGQQRRFAIAGGGGVMTGHL
jgi:hypothetical protein